MQPTSPSRCLALTEWIVRSNPAYLISACFIALGARHYLADPTDPAGDMFIIILTLVALQLYEWSVGSVLLLLHRARRSPEDLRSLLLVSTLFWTGPMAATIEMSVYRPRLGLAVSIGVSLIAIAEVIAINRMLRLNFGSALQTVSIACAVFLTIATALMTSAPAHAGVTEIYLYALWWALAALMIPLPRILRRKDDTNFENTNCIPLTNAMIRRGFMVITFLVLGVHLFGMNYALYCHASLFYAAPALLAIAYIGLALIKKSKHIEWVWALAGLPFIAIILGRGQFRPEVPVELLPEFLRQPFLSLLVPAALVWWYAYRRHGLRPLLHAANAAMAYAGIELIGDAAFGWLALPENKVIALSYAVAIYFALMALLHRSRIEGAVALLINLFATVVAIKAYAPHDQLLITIAIGWTMFLGIHIVVARPGLASRLFAVGLLLGLPWLVRDADQFKTELSVYCQAIIMMLFIFGWLAPWTRYRTIAGAIVLIEATAIGARQVVLSENPLAAIFVIAGFALLIGGTLVSWHKERLLQEIRQRLETPPTPPVDESVSV